MACRHCGSEETNLNKILCDVCSKKALQVLPTDPKERVHIYKILIESAENPITRMAAQQLMEEDVDVVEQEMYDPTDRMFTERF